MRLDQWAVEGKGNPELIRRNLDAVLAQISAVDPPSSPLIVRARQSHGMRRGEMSKPLNSYQAALLLNWLSEAAGIEPEAEVQETTPVPSPVGEESFTSDDAPASKPRSVSPAADAEFKPRDEFDPEIFNRRVAESAASAASPAAGHDSEIPAADNSENSATVTE
jgi:hypothetical protein